MAGNNGRESYFDVLTAAINDIVGHGYDTPERIAFWTRRLKEAAETSMQPPAEMEAMLRDALAGTYKRLIDGGKIAEFNRGVQRFTIERVRPQLRAELDRRILASADLIKLNKKAAVEKTLQRFQGWSTSIPKGGTENAKKAEVKAGIRKSMRALPFEERRVIIDQGFKLRSSLSHILASDGGAIGGIWHSHWKQAGYNYRVDHKERDEHFFLLRDNWAQAKGLVKVGPDGYIDQQTEPAEEPFCRCWYEWVYQLRDVPDACMTAKGRDALADARAKVAAMA